MTAYGTAYVRGENVYGDIEIEPSLEAAQEYVNRFGKSVQESTHGRLELVVVTIERYVAPQSIYLDPEPWVNGHVRRFPDAGENNSMDFWQCSNCIRVFAPRKGYSQDWSDYA